MPAFVVNATQILKNINNLPRARGTAAAPAIRGTGSNRIPLGPVSGNKRRGDEIINVLSSTPKRQKSEHPRQPYSIIDLDDPVEYVPTSRPRPRQASNRTSKAARSRPSKSQRKAPTRDQTSRESAGFMAHIASKLRASAHAVAVDRDALRRRWAVDEKLRLQSVTDHLEDLNECFGRAEDGMRDALDVIERRLL